MGSEVDVRVIYAKEALSVLDLIVPVILRRQPLDLSLKEVGEGIDDRSLARLRRLRLEAAPSLLTPQPHCVAREDYVGGPISLAFVLVLAGELLLHVCSRAEKQFRTKVGRLQTSIEVQGGVTAIICCSFPVVYGHVIVCSNLSVEEIERVLEVDLTTDLKIELREAASVDNELRGDVFDVLRRDEIQDRLVRELPQLHLHHALVARCERRRLH